jgi:hypothetical protein
MGSRTDRLKDYANPTNSKNWCGESTKEYVARWSARASANSQLAPRAKGGEIELPDTSESPAVTHPRFTGDARAEGKQGNFAGSSPFAKGVRRIT